MQMSKGPIFIVNSSYDEEEEEDENMLIMNLRRLPSTMRRTLNGLTLNDSPGGELKFKGAPRTK